jgi:hypothetical protein
VNHLGRSATRIRMRAADVGDGPDEDAILRFEAHARKVPGTDRMLRWAILVVFVLLLICIVLLAAPGLGRDIWDEIQYRMQPAPVFPPVAPLPPPPPPAIPPTS